VLGAYRLALDRDPLLVVPTAADADHYRRELAGEGVVFGSQVLSASRFAAELVRRSGVGGRPLGPLARERVAAAVAGRTPLEALGASARTPGFARALLRLADELAERRVDPARFAGAMRAWAGEEPARAAYASELARLHGALRHALDGLGRPDPVLRAFAALDALRTEPWRWGGAPVFLYGFDDLSALQLDAVVTLARHVAADVTVSLTYEPGRVAFAGRGATFQELDALADRHERLQARTEHYAPASRTALHHLERSLFEPEPAPAVVPRGAVRLLEGGGPRTELELVAADIAALLRDGGLAAEDVAVVLRDPEPAWPLLRDVFSACGLNAALDRRVAAGHTAIGRGVVALLRSAALEGSADDLLAWLRTPGLLERPALADGLEALVRREGAATAAAARALWEGRHPTFPLTELDRVAEGAERGPAALCDRLEAEVARLFAAPWRGGGAVLSGPAELEARVAGALREALGELAALAAAEPRLAPDAAALAEVLAAVEVRTGAPEPGAIAVTRPQAIRARRVRALFLCGLQEGTFPAPARPEPFLGDAERRAVNRLSGLRLPLREDALAVERAFFYAAVSRPTERLTLSWHAADEDGAPQVPSLFWPTCATSSRRSSGRAAGGGSSAPRDGRAARRARPSSGGRRRRTARGPPSGRSPRCATPTSSPAWPPRARGRPRRSSSGPAARSAGSSSAGSGPRRSSRTPRPCAAAGWHTRSSRTCCARCTSAAWRSRPSTWRRRASGCTRPSGAAPTRRASRRTPSAGARSCAAWRPTSCATWSSPPTTTRPTSPRASRWPSAARATSWAGGPGRRWPRASRAHRPRRPRAFRPPAIVVDYKGSQGYAGATWVRDGRLAGRAVHARARAAPGRRRGRRPVPAAQQQGHAPARGAARRRRPRAHDGQRRSRG
jgi:hypothetical protein